MLRIEYRQWYKVKEGQTLDDVARAFCVSTWVLVKENGLIAPPKCGSVLYIPACSGNVYIAKAGDTKTLLCGSEERYLRQNGTDVLYPGMRVIL